MLTIFRPNKTTNTNNINYFEPFSDPLILCVLKRLESMQDLLRVRRLSKRFYKVISEHPRWSLLLFTQYNYKNAKADFRLYYSYKMAEKQLGFSNLQINQQILFFPDVLKKTNSFEVHKLVVVSAEKCFIHYVNFNAQKKHKILKIDLYKHKTKEIASCKNYVGVFSFSSVTNQLIYSTSENDRCSTNIGNVSSRVLYLMDIKNSKKTEQHKFDDDLEVGSVKESILYMISSFKLTRFDLNSGHTKIINTQEWVSSNHIITHLYCPASEPFVLTADGFNICFWNDTDLNLLKTMTFKPNSVYSGISCISNTIYLAQTKSSEISYSVISENIQWDTYNFANKMKLKGNIIKLMSRGQFLFVNTEIPTPSKDVIYSKIHIIDTRVNKELTNITLQDKVQDVHLEGQRLFILAASGSIQVYSLMVPSGAKMKKIASLSSIFK